MTGETPDPLVLSAPIAGALEAVEPRCDDPPQADGTVARTDIFGPGNPFGFSRGADALVAPPPEWIIPGVITRYGTAMIHAAPKAGKSLVALDIAAAVLGGFKFAGELQARTVDYVVYMSGEGQADRGTRLHALLKAYPDLDRELIEQRFIYADNVPQLAQKLGEYSTVELGEWLSALRAGAVDDLGEPSRFLVILDTWANAAGDIDSNEGQIVADALGRVAIMGRKHHLATLIVHHSNKEGKFNGSNQFFANVDTLFKLASTGKTTGTLELEGGKYSGGFVPRGYEIVAPEITYTDRRGTVHTVEAPHIRWTGKVTSEIKPKAKKEEALDAAVTFLVKNEHRSAETGIRSKDLATALKGDGITDTTLRAAIDSALKDKDKRLGKGFARREIFGAKSGPSEVSVLFSPEWGDTEE